MSWLSKNVGSLSNLASRIAAETNGEHGSNEATQQLQQELRETREEFIARHQEWEQAKQNYESRLQSLTNGDATAQKVEQLEQKLNRAVGLLKNLQSDKQNLTLKVKSLEEEKGEAMALAEAAKEIQRQLEQQQLQQQQLNGQASPKSDHAGHEVVEKMQQLEKELTSEKEQRTLLVQELKIGKEQSTLLVQKLKAEKEQSASLVEELKSQLLEATENNKKLEGQLVKQREESDSQMDISIELNMAKDDLEQALAEIESLKEANAKLSSKPKSAPMSPVQQQSPTLVKELAEAKATIAQLESKLSKESAAAKESAALKATQAELQDTVETMRKDLTQANNSYAEAQKELSEQKATRAALEKKEATLAKSIARLESELTAAKTVSEGETSANCADEASMELQSRIQELEHQLETSKEEFSNEHIDAVVLAIQALLGPSRTDALPQSLVNDKVLATWNRAKDEVDSYKDGNRSLEDNLSRLRRENQDVQAALELAESEKTQQLEALRKDHEQSISELEQKFQSDSHNQEDLSLQISTLKLSAEESRKALEEHFEAEKKQLIAKQETLREECKTMKETFQEELLAAEASQRERDLTIQKLQATVASNEQVLATIKEDLQKTTNERNHFQTQHKTLLDRVSNMKSTLGTKLQADMDNINTLRQQIDQLTAQNNDYLLTIKQLEEELMASHEHYEKTSRELEHLRRRLVDIQEDASAEVVEKENLIHELQSRLQREEREREDWETMASEQRASKDQAIVNMRAMERERDAARAEKESIRVELDREIESLNNLQSVLEEFQSAKESEIQFALEGLHRQLNHSNASLEEFQHRALTAEEQLQNLTLDVERAHQLEREVKEKNLTIGNLRRDAVIQQGHLTEAMRRLREENSQNTVDIPLISNLFISFLNIPRGDQKRFEILQLISGVLKFTDEQREQAGLIRKAGGFGAMTPSASGSRSPSMEQMRQPPPEPREPLQIHWHDKQPIYSAHFEPGPKGRLATAGGDGNVRLWKVVKDKEKDSTHIEFLSSLNRHTAAVNVVRFSPTVECLASAGDDGNIILWRPTENKEVVSRFAESDDEEFERETWRVQSMMRGSLSDIYDIAWSPDGRFIISGSIDNTARIWDVRDAKCIHVIADHRHYVQGVAWDPLGDYVATQSSDRSVHIYGFKIDKNGHVVVNNLGKSTKLDLSKLRSAPQPAVATATTSTSTSNSAQTKSTGDTDMAVDSTTEKEDASKPVTRTPKTFRLYHDETLTSFFRRLSFTPDGSMLITPAGQYRAPIQRTTTQKDDESSTATAAPQSSELEMRNTAYIYARRDFGRGPVAHLPGHKKPSVAIKCSPVLYELRPIQPAGPSSSYYRPAATTASSSSSSTTTTTTTTTTVAAASSTQEKVEAPKAPSVFGLGYRSIYAVATQDSILIYDTQQSAALALVSHLHYATFTDMAWSSDGCNLILTSSDGFCSIISFEEGELGTVYTPPKSMMDLLPAPNSTLTPLNESLDTAANIAATAGMLQKLNGLSLTEKKEQKGSEKKEPKEPKAKAKQEKGESAGATKKSASKKQPGKTQSTLSTPVTSGITVAAAKIASATTTATQSPASVSPAESPKTSFKTERDGDSVMSIASEQPTPKKRRIQPTFVSALPGTTAPAPVVAAPVIPSPAPSPLTVRPLTSMDFAQPSSPATSSATTAKPKKRIAPTFVSALPGH
ncbi:hypothetical protein BGZ97_013042 [Linnemannia gamsii]|uniref:GRIP domain-containing protein n=1 Tax=Linnemannia gamsii TaxID=64522 RepID=A0A9P6R069_9FUNG|nr:hypothetical protein BGZ97_013042 [Linnemannia gamsii]